MNPAMQGMRWEHWINELRAIGQQGTPVIDVVVEPSPFPYGVSKVGGN